VTEVRGPGDTHVAHQHGTRGGGPQVDGGATPEEPGPGDLHPLVDLGRGGPLHRREPRVDEPPRLRSDGDAHHVRELRDELAMSLRDADVGRRDLGAVGLVHTVRVERGASADHRLEREFVEALAAEPLREPLLVVAPDAEGATRDEELEDARGLGAAVAEVAEHEDRAVVELREEALEEVGATVNVADDRRLRERAFDLDAAEDPHDRRIRGLALEYDRRVVKEQRWVAAALKEPEVMRVASREVAVFAAPYDVDVSNEDAVALIEVGANVVIVVADGAGGHPGGGDAAELAVAAVCEALDGVDEVGVREAVLRGFEAGQAAVLDLGGAATTLTVVEVAAQWMRTYHAGDSQALLLDRDGDAVFETRAHTPSGHAFEAGLFDLEHALENRHLVTNVLGGTPLYVDMVLPRTWPAGGTLVVGSDGLFDNLDVEEIGARMGGSVGEVARALSVAASERMVSDHPLAKVDDLSFVVVR